MSLERFELCTSNSRKLKSDVKKSIKFRGKGRSFRAFRSRCNPVFFMITALQSFRRLVVLGFGIQTFRLFHCRSASVPELMDKLCVYFAENHGFGMGGFMFLIGHDRMYRFEHNNKSFAVDLV